jgi:hypothetical protein
MDRRSFVIGTAASAATLAAGLRILFSLRITQ